MIPGLRIIMLTALLVPVSGAAVAAGASFGAGIENSQWYLSESVFDCTLTHEVPGYGRAIFRHRAGESLGFHLEADLPLMRPGMGVLVVEAPSWRPGASTRPVGRVQVSGDRRSVTVDSRRAMILVQGLLDGMAPTITRQSDFDDTPVRVRVSNVNFARQFDAYRTCVTGLLPVNYDQIQRSRIAFASGSSRLSDRDRAQLDDIVAYVRADQRIERIFVDGHTDRRGSRIQNRAMSEARARAVADYMLAQGVAEDLVIVRSHADQYPVSGNPADNRRTTIRLQRQGERPRFQRADGPGYGASADG